MATTEKEMAAKKLPMAEGLLASLKEKFDIPGLQVGHGLAKDKDENLSYYFKIYGTGSRAPLIKKAAETFLSDTCPNEKVTVSVASTKYLGDVEAEIFDLGTAFVGTAIRKML